MSYNELEFRIFVIFVPTGKADGAWHGRTAPLAWGEPGGITPASGHERGNRTADGDVEAAVDAAVDASVDADVGADVDASCNSGVGAGVNAGVGADAGGAGVGAVVGGLLVRFKTAGARPSPSFKNGLPEGEFESS